MGSGKRSSRSAKRHARREVNRATKEVFASAMAWRSLPWWKRAMLRVRWVFTGELRRAS